MFVYRLPDRFIVLVWSADRFTEGPASLPIFGISQLVIGPIGGRHWVPAPEIMVSFNAALIGAITSRLVMR